MTEGTRTPTGPLPGLPSCLGPLQTFPPQSLAKEFSLSNLDFSMPLALGPALDPGNILFFP